jgi:hypothetical protein
MLRACSRLGGISKDVIEGALVKDYEKVYKQSLEDPEKFWGGDSKRA